MKKDFIDELRRELEQAGVSKDKAESIIDDYEKTIDIGLDAGIEFNDIVRKIGTPKSIAREFRKDYDDVDYSKLTKYIYEVEKPYDIDLGLINGFVEIKYHNSPKLVVIASEENDEYFLVQFIDNKLSIKNKKQLTFAFRDKRRGDFKIFLPDSIKQMKVKIDDVNTNLYFESFDCELFSYATVNGELKFDRLRTLDCKIKAVNGKMNIDTIDANKLAIDTVSGSVKIKEIYSKRVDVSNLSGKIEINKVDQDVIKTSGFGSVKIN